MSQDIKDKMSKSRKGHITTIDTKDKISEANKRRKYIHKDGIRKFVKPQELDEYLKLGWIEGYK